MPVDQGPSVIRQLRPEDQPRLRHFRTASFDFYKTGVPDEVYAATFTRHLGDPPEFNALVAEVDGRTLGRTHYLFQRHV